MITKISVYIVHDDDEVRRVCKTPCDPCGCTWQHSQMSGVPLPSPWNVVHFFVFEKHTSSPPGYLGHTAHTPGSLSMSLTITLFQVRSCESVYGLARLHTILQTINYTFY